MKDLRGSTALAYEADVALILNEKSRVVARHHLVYCSRDAASSGPRDLHGREEPVGRANVDLELRKRFAHGCFEPEAASSPSSSSTAASTSTDRVAA